MRISGLSASMRLKPMPQDQATTTRLQSKYSSSPIFSSNTQVFSMRFGNLQPAVETKILLGRPVADQLVNDFKSKYEGQNLFLVTLVVGDDPASLQYAMAQSAKAKDLNVRHKIVRIPATIKPNELIRKIRHLNKKGKVTGIQLLVPLPPALRSMTSEFQRAISPNKDVEGTHPFNLAELSFSQGERLPKVIPPTALGVSKILDYYKIDVQGKKVVVSGIGPAVGKPIAELMSKRQAAVTMIDKSAAHLLPDEVREADVIIASSPVPYQIKGEWLVGRKNPTPPVVINVSTIYVPGNPKMVGAVDHAGFLNKAGYLTPEYGGTTLVTNAALFYNLGQLHDAHNHKNSPKKVITFPDERLRQPSLPVPGLSLEGVPSAEHFYQTLPKGVAQTVRDLIVTMKAAGEHSTGLSAPQIGNHQRIFVTRRPAGNDGGKLQFVPNRYLAFINPQEIQGGGMQFGWEGCLSIPAYKCQVERYKKINRLPTIILEMDESPDGHLTCVEAQDFPAWECTNKLFARLVQHELDHLNGELILDKARDGQAFLRASNEPLKVSDIQGFASV